MASPVTLRSATPQRCTDLYWTNPMCVHFSQVKMSNLVLADHAGTVVEGKYAINRAGFVLHSAVHAAHIRTLLPCVMRTRRTGPRGARRGGRLT